MNVSNNAMDLTNSPLFHFGTSAVGFDSSDYTHTGTHFENNFVKSRANNIPIEAIKKIKPAIKII